jgi:hypothetical protein
MTCVSDTKIERGHHDGGIEISFCLFGCVDALRQVGRCRFEIEMDVVINIGR